MAAASAPLLTIATILAIGFLASLFFSRTRIPDTIFLLAVGLLLGPLAYLYGGTPLSREGLIAISPVFLSVALMLILFDSGLELDVDKLAKRAGRATYMAFAILIVSIIAIAIFAHYVIGLDPLTALLLGTVLGGTSAEMILPVVGKLRTKEDAAFMLDIETIITDPFIIMTAILLIGTILSGGLNAATLTGGLGNILLIAVIGFTAGIGWAWFIPRVERYQYYYTLTLAFLFGIYALADSITIGGGAVAAFLIGLVLGNSDKVRDFLRIKKLLEGLNQETRKFNDLFTFFVRTFFFVYLGALVTFDDPILFAYGVLIALIMLVVRHFVVNFTTQGMNLNAADRLVIVFMYPRGLATAVLASIPFTNFRIPGTEIFTPITFALIVATIIISTVGVTYAQELSKWLEKVQQISTG